MYALLKITHVSDKINGDTRLMSARLFMQIGNEITRYELSEKAKESIMSSFAAVDHQRLKILNAFASGDLELSAMTETSKKFDSDSLSQIMTCMFRVPRQGMNMLNILEQLDLEKEE